MVLMSPAEIIDTFRRHGFNLIGKRPTTYGKDFFTGKRGVFRAKFKKVSQ